MQRAPKNAFILDPHAIVVGFLEHFGYEPEKIREDPARKTPDFRCATEDAVFIFELKSRAEDVQEEARRRPILESGEIYGFHQGVGRRNTVSGLIDEAVEQLIAHTEADVFRLAWLYTGTQRADMRHTQFKASLYGMESVTSLEWGHWMWCLYFTNSDFFRHRATLDGAVVVSPGESGFDAALFLNDHAPRYPEASIIWRSVASITPCNFSSNPRALTYSVRWFQSPHEVGLARAEGYVAWTIHGRDALRRSNSTLRSAARTSKNRSRRFLSNPRPLRPSQFGGSKMQ